MLYETIHLKDRFPFLGENDCDPYLTAYVPDFTEEMRNKEMQPLRPAVLILPGGGYSYVSSREGEPIALHFLTRGFHTFVLNYSTAPHTFPTSLREVAAAMELIFENAEKWLIDTSRIAIMGFSAGGHLAGHYSNCFDCREVRELFPESKPVNAAVLCYPVISAAPEWRHMRSFQNISGSKELTQDIIDQFSLQNLVSANTPPTFLWHTQEDKLVPCMNTLLYAQALAENQIPFAVHIYPNGPHGLSAADRTTCKALAESVKQVHGWMDEASRWLMDIM